MLCKALDILSNTLQAAETMRLCLRFQLLANLAMDGAGSRGRANNHPTSTTSTCYGVREGKMEEADPLISDLELDFDVALLAHNQASLHLLRINTLRGTWGTRISNFRLHKKIIEHMLCITCVDINLTGAALACTRED